eukprot:11171118-Ditylum_brightwellii.AAC.1
MVSSSGPSPTLKSLTALDDACTSRRSGAKRASARSSSASVASASTERHTLLSLSSSSRTPPAASG